MQKNKPQCDDDSLAEIVNGLIYPGEGLRIHYRGCGDNVLEVFGYLLANTATKVLIGMPNDYQPPGGCREGNIRAIPYKHIVGIEITHPHELRNLERVLRTYENWDETAWRRKVDNALWILG